MADSSAEHRGKKRNYTLSISVWVFVCALGAVLSESPLSNLLDHHFVQRINFMSRRAFNEQPRVDARIKIYALEDNSVSNLNAPDLNLAQWTTLISTIAKTKPRAIVIDKIFGYLPGETDESVAAFRDFLANLQVPVITGVFSTNKEVKTRAPLPEYNKHNFAAYLKGTLQPQDIAWIKERPIFLYGAQKSIADAFPVSGHITYEGDGYVYPFLRPELNRVVPHVSLMLGKDLEIYRDGFVVDGIKVEANSNGLIPVNFLPPEDLLGLSLRLANIFVYAKHNRPLPELREGDIVIVLPLMYTGNTDFKETAVGRIPGGFILASMINSTLTGNWLRSAEYRGLLLAIGAAITTAAPIFLPITSSFLVLILTSLLMITGGIALFVYGGVVTEWLTPAVFSAIAGSIVLGRKYYETELTLRNLRRDLRGRISSDRVAEFVKQRRKLMNEAAEQILTIMFIDMVGFSKNAMKKTPRHVFGDLKIKLEMLRTIVHKHGGLIDRTMGDGMLCVFGFEIDESNPDITHADMALKCAVEIQRANIAQILSSDNKRGDIFPLRIGINTAASFVGNLGDEDQLDLTVVGNGVNFAQRLESTCERNMIMLGATTCDLLTTDTVRKAPLSKRLIKIKHQEEFIEAYEYNPFADDIEKLRAAETRYFKSIGAERLEDRFTVYDKELLLVDCEFGIGRIADFSRGGMAIALQKYFATGVTFGIKMFSKREAQPQIGIAPLTVEIKWAKPLPDGSYLHGCQFKNLNTMQKGEILEVLRKFLADNNNHNVGTDNHQVSA